MKIEVPRNELQKMVQQYLEKYKRSMDERIESDAIELFMMPDCLKIPILRSIMKNIFGYCETKEECIEKYMKSSDYVFFRGFSYETQQRQKVLILELALSSTDADTFELDGDDIEALNNR